jgi:hypothetical protein
MKLVSLIFLSFFVAATSSPREVKKLRDSELEQREAMIKMSRQLGVTCAYCHDVSNFKNRSMATYKVAADHLAMIELLNARSFTLKNGPRADCYMCHRGKAIPDYKELTQDASKAKH